MCSSSTQVDIFPEADIHEVWLLRLLKSVGASAVERGHSLSIACV